MPGLQSLMRVAFEPRSSDIISDLSVMLQIARCGGGGWREGRGEGALFRKGGKTLGKKLQVREQVWARSDTGSTIDASGPSLSAKNSEFWGGGGMQPFPDHPSPVLGWGRDAGEPSGLGVQASILRMRVV